MGFNIHISKQLARKRQWNPEMGPSVYLSKLHMSCLCLHSSEGVFDFKINMNVPKFVSGIYTSLSLFEFLIVDWKKSKASCFLLQSGSWWYIPVDYSLIFHELVCLSTEKNILKGVKFSLLTLVNFILMSLKIQSLKYLSSSVFHQNLFNCSSRWTWYLAIFYRLLIFCLRFQTVWYDLLIFAQPLPNLGQYSS